MRVKNLYKIEYAQILRNIVDQLHYWLPATKTAWNFEHGSIKQHLRPRTFNQLKGNNIFNKILNS